MLLHWQVQRTPSPWRDGDVSGSLDGGDTGGSVEEPRTTHLSEDSVIVLPARAATAEVK